MNNDYIYLTPEFVESCIAFYLPVKTRIKDFLAQEQKYKINYLFFLKK